MHIHLCFTRGDQWGECSHFSLCIWFVSMIPFVFFPGTFPLSSTLLGGFLVSDFFFWLYHIHKHLSEQVQWHGSAMLLWLYLWHVSQPLNDLWQVLKYSANLIAARCRWMWGFKIKMLYLWLLKKFMSLPGQLQQFPKVTLWPHSDCWSFSSDTLLLYFSCFYTLCSVFVPNSNGWWVWDWVTMTDCFPALCGGETDTHTEICFIFSRATLLLDEKINRGVE